MVMVEMKGLHTVKVNGQTYYYAWRGGPRLLSPYGTTEFHKEFSDHKSPLGALDKRKLGAWITLYKASDNYKGLATSTKYRWATWLDRIREEFGDLRVAQFDRPEIRGAIKNWRNKWKHSPRQADMGKQVLSVVLAFIVDDGKLNANPCPGITNLYTSDRSDIIWLAEDLDKLTASCSPEIAHAARLAALTGLRQGDLFRLSWNHIKPLAIELKTGKSRGRRTVIIPLYGELSALLKAIPRKSTAVLTNSRGKPWRGFGSSWTKAMTDCGLADDDRNLHFHDLRGTAATNLFLADFSIREIAEILGWSEDQVEKIINRYVKRDEILRDKIRRMDSANAVKLGVKPT